MDIEDGGGRQSFKMSKFGASKITVRLWRCGEKQHHQECADGKQGSALA